jgi:hypothetical protein
MSFERVLHTTYKNISETHAAHVISIFRPHVMQVVHFIMCVSVKLNEIHVIL